MLESDRKRGAANPLMQVNFLGDKLEIRMYKTKAVAKIVWKYDVRCNNAH